MHFILFVGLCIMIMACKTTEKKVEIERSVSRQKFPMEALKFLEQNYPERKNEGFYLEKSNDTTFYESKFESKDSIYSIKFYSNGELYDHEVLINKEQIPSACWQTIKNSLNQQFISWDIQKIQLRSYQSSRQYEIVLSGRTKSVIRHYEFKFSDNGEIIEKLQLQDRPSDMFFN